MRERVTSLGGTFSAGPGHHGGFAVRAVLTTFDLDEYVYAALQAGASGFLLKDTPRAGLLAAVRAAAAGDVLLSPVVTTSPC